MLLAQKVDGDVFTALKPICEGMGIDPNGQMQRLKKQPWAVACVIHATGSDGKTYQMFGVNRKTLTMWLATIDTSRIKDPTVRHNVVTYQNECAEALDAYFNHGVAVRDHDDPDRRVRILSEAMLIAQQEMQSKDLTITRQQRELDERRPLALLGEAFVSTDGTMSVTQAARHFQTIDRRMTRDMIYGLLRGAGYVETHGNAPTKKAIKPGYLVQRQHIRDDRKLGKPYARFTTKGVNWFIRRFIYGDGQPALEGVD
jgi:phage antirepressor YoqD-like protein